MLKSIRDAGDPRSTPEPLAVSHAPHDAPRMASHSSHDPRLESLVVERTTRFDEECAALDAGDRRWLARTLHREPDRAADLRYERTHTGFARAITVTRADVERLYRERVAA